MSSCVNNNINGNCGVSQDGRVPQTGVQYFDGEGKLLPAHYSFIYDQTVEAARRHNKDLSWMRQEDPLDKRRMAAKRYGWEVGASYCRCSTDMQDSYQGQMTSCIDKAVANDIIIFPELAAGDEAVSGKRGDRSGLELVRSWVRAGEMTVFVAFSISRLFRRLHKGLQFVREDVIEHGIRVLAVAEHLDSADKQFSMILNVNMMVAEMQASALPEFVRMGQKAHVENGFLVGACPLGYKPVPVPEAGFTKKGKVKTRAEIVPEVAAIIRRSYERIGEGVTISEACRLYNQDVAGLPENVRQYAVDPRSSTRTMRPEAFRKLLCRERYTGVWRFGVLRNQWLDGKNTTVQVAAPEHEVITYENEDLRIVSDELFHRAQQKLSEGIRGRHGPRTGREASLATSLINMYRCSECGHAFHYYGLQYMHCPESTKGTCSNKGTVEREYALKAIVTALREQIQNNTELVAEIVRQSRELDMAMDEDNVAKRIGILEKGIRRLNTLMTQIEDSCGDDGMDKDEQDRHRKLKADKSRLMSELVTLKARSSEKHEPITETEVLSILSSFDSLLDDAGTGNLGGDSKQQAAALIRDLVGGTVTVSFKRLQGRRAFGVGTFTPAPVLALARHHKNVNGATTLSLPATTVEFRKLPRYARIADEVYRLHMDEGLSFTELGKRFKCGSGNAWGAFAYWHESRGYPVPYKRDRYRKRKEGKAS